jgi:hypothetical protein
MPHVSADVRGYRGSTSGAPADSRSRGRCHQAMAAHDVEDNFAFNIQNQAEDGEILPNAQVPVYFQT